MRPIWHIALGILATATLLVCATVPSNAQVVRGQVVDSTSGVPVGIGFVVLLNSAGREVDRALTTRDGAFTLRAPGPGVYRLRSERIGYRAHESAPFEVAPNATVSRTLRIIALPVRLEAVEVREESECRVNPERAAATAVIWEEVRKALAATAWDGTQELARYRKYGYERELTGDRRRIISEDGRIVEGVAGQPYTSLPAPQLARQGYIVAPTPDEIAYALPDAAVLTDDAFLGTHCFQVVRDPETKPGQVGLAFEPVSDHGVTEVRGALWLDESTSELRTLEVTYTALPQGVEDDRVGGTVEFLQLPSGAWIVQHWQVRTPILRVVTGGDAARFGHRRTSYLVGFRDIGGDVLEVVTRDGTKLYPPNLAHLAGTVYDSTRNGPLAGARVTITGTVFATETDVSGSFHLTAPLSGDYSMAVSHPWLDSIAYMEEHPVHLARDSTRTILVAVPHARTMAARWCPETDGRPEFGIVVGRVARENDVDPAQGARVSASWQIIESREGRLVPRDVQAVVRVDELGFYALCGIPAGHPVTIRAQDGRTTSRTADLVFPHSEEGALLLAWDRSPGQPYGESYQTGRRIWKLDLRLRRNSEAGRVASRTLSGFVADRATAQPIGGATVYVNGADTTTTRPDGTFDLVDVDWLPGANVVALRRLGYEPWAQQLWLERDATRVDLSVALRPQAVEVDPVEVTAMAVEQYLTEVGFYERKKANRGHFIEREQIEQRIGAASNVSELLTGLPGVTVLDSRPGVLGSGVAVRGIARPGGCGAPRIFVDGLPVVVDDFQSLGMVVRPEDVYAIEVYRTPSEIPPQYGGPESACGVLLIWTK